MKIALHARIQALLFHSFIHICECISSICIYKYITIDSNICLYIHSFVCVCVTLEINGHAIFFMRIAQITIMHALYMLMNKLHMKIKLHSSA